MDDPLYMDAYERWKGGFCPCCGNPIEEDDRPLAIGEGVMICGYCHRLGHHEIPDPEHGCPLAEMMLKYILKGAVDARNSAR